MKRILRLAAPLLAAAFAGPAMHAQATAPVTVELLAQARVGSVEVEVADVARVSGGPAGAAERVAATNLGSAPAPGYSRVFRADRVLAAIERQHPDLAVRLAGGPACRVHPNTETIAPERLVELARRRVAEEYAGQDVELELLGETRAVAVPAGNRELEVRVRPGELSRTPTGVSVPVEVLVDGIRYRTVWIAWAVSRWSDEDVLARPVEKGEVLTAAHFRRQRVQVTAASESALGPRALDGAVMLKEMLAGEPVTASDVFRPKVVTLGDTVFLEVRSRGVAARVTAVALGTGAIGDRIRVQTIGSQQELMATVRGRDLCRIDLQLPRAARRTTHTLPR